MKAAALSMREVGSLQSVQAESQGKIGDVSGSADGHVVDEWHVILHKRSDVVWRGTVIKLE